MFIAGPVARNSATEIGKVTSATSSRMPIVFTAASIAGSDASDERVEIATAVGATIPRVKSPGPIRAAINTSG